MTTNGNCEEKAAEMLPADRLPTGDWTTLKMEAVLMRLISRIRSQNRTLKITPKILKTGLYLCDFAYHDKNDAYLTGETYVNSSGPSPIHFDKALGELITDERVLHVDEKGNVDFTELYIGRVFEIYALNCDTINIPRKLDWRFLYEYNEIVERGQPFCDYTRNSIASPFEDPEAFHILPKLSEAELDIINLVADMMVKPKTRAQANRLVKDSLPLKTASPGQYLDHGLSVGIYEDLIGGGN